MLAQVADWQAIGIWSALHRALLERLNDVKRLDWSQAALDRAAVPAKEGGKAAGPKLTDCGKPGMRRHLVVDWEGTSLGITLSAAKRHDSLMLAPPLSAAPIPSRPASPSAASTPSNALAGTAGPSSASSLGSTASVAFPSATSGEPTSTTLPPPSATPSAASTRSASFVGCSYAKSVR